MNQYYDQRPRNNTLKTVLLTLLIVLLIALFVAGGLALYNILNTNIRKAIEPSTVPEPAYTVTEPEQKSEVSEPSSEPVLPEKEPEQSENTDNTGTDTKIEDNTDPKYSDISSLSTAEVAEKAIPSVVCIQNYRQVYRNNAAFSFQQQQESAQPVLAGEGSGVIYSSDGFIITNHHVIKDASLIMVVLSDGTTYEAKLIGADADTDLALIKIDATGLTPMEIGDYSELKVGEFVMAIGNPGGHEFSSSVSLGIVSAKDRPLQIDNGYLMNTIQTDAAINPGNSGGALVNMKGQLVGINSAKYVASGYEGLGFSITVEEAIPIIEDLKANGKVTGRALLGISGVYLDDLVAARYGLTKGYYVYQTVNTQTGTLQADDIITKVNGTDVVSESTIKNAIAKKKAGDTIEIQYWRDGTLYTTQVVLISADN